MIKEDNIKINPENSPVSTDTFNEINNSISFNIKENNINNIKIENSHCIEQDDFKEITQDIYSFIEKNINGKIFFI